MEWSQIAIMVHSDYSIHCMVWILFGDLIHSKKLIIVSECQS